MKNYCTQNNGDCETCSLVNYGLDCQNQPIHDGEARAADTLKWLEKLEGLPSDPDFKMKYCG